ncbi:hypothetical protein Holit_03381 [Hollandina sp. SP2]
MFQPARIFDLIQEQDFLPSGIAEKPFETSFVVLGSTGNHRYEMVEAESFPGLCTGKRGKKGKPVYNIP